MKNKERFRIVEYENRGGSASYHLGERQHEGKTAAKFWQLTRLTFCGLHLQRGTLMACNGQ